MFVIRPHGHGTLFIFAQDQQNEARQSPQTIWLQVSIENQDGEFWQNMHLMPKRSFMQSVKRTLLVNILIKNQIFSFDIKYYKGKLMENNAQNKKIPSIYMAETALKAAFIFMAIFNMSYTVTVGFLASACGLIRMLKAPKFSKEYLQKALLNNHGQNILYIGMGCVGTTNFLFFAPLILYFFYGLAQFYNQMFPAAAGKIKGYVDTIRNNRWYFMQTKSRLQIIYFIYLLVTIPIDFGRILKCLLIGQYNMLKFRVTPETAHAAKNINQFISNKISGIGFLHKLYTKLIDYIYKFATQNPGQ